MGAPDMYSDMYIASDAVNIYTPVTFGDHLLLTIYYYYDYMVIHTCLPGLF